MIRFAAALLSALICCFSATAQAQGTLNLALVQQFSFVGCSTAANVCGTPLIGGLLYFYQVGTVSTRQDSFQDTGLTIPNQWPLQLDANGRVPMFYLANGSVHVRLTDAGGVVQFDYPSMLVVGPSGGGGGGSTVSADQIFTTGDIKFRMSGEALLNWVKLNGQTVAQTSGASLTGSQYQNLYTYLWQNCTTATNTHCPVTGGKGANANADWTANKAIQLPDWRGRAPVGLDDMGNTAAGRLTSNNITSGGSDTVTTAGAWGGEANHTMKAAEMATHTHFLTFFDPGHFHSITDVAHTHTDSGHTHTFSANAGTLNTVTSGSGIAVLSSTTGTTGTGFANISSSFTGITQTQSKTTGGLICNGTGDCTLAANQNRTQNCTGLADGVACTDSPANVMDPFVLGSWYVHL